MYHYACTFLLCWTLGSLLAQHHRHHPPRPIASAVAGHFTDSTALFWLAFHPHQKPDAADLQTIIQEQHGDWLGRIDQLIIQDTIRHKRTLMYHILCKRTPPRPATDDITFLAGSCAFQFPFPWHAKRNRRNEIFQTMQDSTRSGDFMVWLGDNVYYVMGQWNSYDKMLKKHLRVRHRQPIRSFMESMPQYATWDDHDFGPNNCDGSIPNKHLATRIFQQVWRNPTYGLQDNQDAEVQGIATHFTQGDAEFFMLDTRFFANFGQATLLGNEQMAWLERKLKASTANFKFIVSGAQVLSLDKNGLHFGKFEQDRQRLLDIISRNDIKGVIFISGDRHFGEIMRWERPNQYPLYEVTTSPLTSFLDERGTTHANRVPNTLVVAPNYARFLLRGAGEQRRCIVELYGTTGNLWWRYEFLLKDLQ